MDGVIQSKRAVSKFGYWLIVPGTLLSAIMIFVLIAGKDELASDDKGAVVFFIVLGAICIVCGIVALLMRKKFYIHAEEDSISAFCQWGGKLNCSMEDVDHIERNGTGYVDREGNAYEDTVLLIYLKNGKKYQIWHLENGEELYRFIRKRLPSQNSIGEPAGDLTKLRTERQGLKKKYRKILIPCICCIPMLIPLILLTVIFTDGKELSEFSQRDWRVFCVFAGISLILIIAFIVLLPRATRLWKKIGRTESSILLTILLTAPLRPGKALRMYLDDPEEPAFRLVVFGLLDYDEVFYVIESIGPDEEIVLLSESKMYSTFEELKPELEELTEVPLPAGEGITQDSAGRPESEA